MKQRDIKDPRVLEAIRKVKRHLFVSESLKPLAYEDTPLPIGYHQTISQPYIVALMTQEALLEPDNSVLEIGTGSGYQSAILAEMVKEVYTVEIIEPLAAAAERRLLEMGYENIHVRHGDGFEGWPEFAPYDAIVVTAAPVELPPKLVEQLAPGGRMVIPLGPSNKQKLCRVTKTVNDTSREDLLPVAFVPMVKK